MIKYLQSCRLCGSDQIRNVFSLGSQQIAGSFGLISGYDIPNRRIPLDLVQCVPLEGGCGLVQLSLSVSPSILYANYGYQSGINQTMRDHLAEIVSRTSEMVRLSAGDVVVDIGANDGTLLAYYPSSIVKIGFEPSDIPDVCQTENIRYIRQFFSAKAFTNAGLGSNAKVVTSIAMFYDLEDPSVFIKDVESILADDGIWVTEFSYLVSMLEKNSFDTICHEHLEYYHLAPLEIALAKFGLSIFDAELNESNGGSIRLYIAKNGFATHQMTPERKLRLYQLRCKELNMHLDTMLPFDGFRTQVEKLRLDLLELLNTLVAQGKQVYGYGASTKGNVILQHLGVSKSVVTAIADRNPRKWGSSTAGTDIPIVSEADMRAAKPDVLLVLPWHFADEFLKREQDFLRAGGEMIFPLPNLRIVGSNA